MGEPRRGLVVGCGGTLGFAWAAVAIEAVERELRWDARTADVLVGTSAGSEMVALIGAGRRGGDIADALRGDSSDDRVLTDHLAHDPGAVPPLPAPGLPYAGLVRAARRGRVDLAAGVLGLAPRGRGDATWLETLGHRLATANGWVPHPATWIVTLDITTGRRVALGSPAAPSMPLGTALAASWAIPGWFPPVDIDGRACVDGGVASTASVDLVGERELDEVIVVAPMASATPVAGRGLSRLERLMRRRMTAGLDTEIGLLRDRGVRVIRIEPGPRDLDAMGWNFMDAERRADVVATASTTCSTRVRDALNQSIGAPT